MPQSRYSLRHRHGFAYLDEGPRPPHGKPGETAKNAPPPVLLFHGMLGDLSNWDATIGALAEAGYRVLVPILPVYDLPMAETSVSGLAEHVRAFVESIDLGPAALVGNSLGGQVALIYALRHRSSVVAMVLSGSSGIYERRMGTDVMRRDSRDFIRERAAITFYDDEHVSDELVEELYEIVNDRARAVRLIRMARSAKNDTVTDRLSTLDLPILLVWGRDDVITPPAVAEQFLQLLPDARLHFIDRCGHAPMIERPEAFNPLTIDFLERVVEHPELASSEAS